MNAAAPSLPVSDSVPEPRAPGRGVFRWSDVYLPLLVSAALIGAAVAFDWRGVPFAIGSVPVFGVLAVFFGWRIGRRGARGGWRSDLFRGALVAELLTLGMAVLYLIWSPNDQQSYDEASVIFAVVFAHLFGLPPLLAAAAFGVSLGVPLPSDDE